MKQAPTHPALPPEAIDALAFLAFRHAPIDPDGLPAEPAMVAWRQDSTVRAQYRSAVATLLHHIGEAGLQFRVAKPALLAEFCDCLTTVPAYKSYDPAAELAAPLPAARDTADPA